MAKLDNRRWITGSHSSSCFNTSISSPTKGSSCVVRLMSAHIRARRSMNPWSMLLERALKPSSSCWIARSCCSHCCFCARASDHVASSSSRSAGASSISRRACALSSAKVSVVSSSTPRIRCSSFAFAVRAASSCSSRWMRWRSGVTASPVRPSNLAYARCTASCCACLRWVSELSCTLTASRWAWWVVMASRSSAASIALRTDGNAAASASACPRVACASSNDACNPGNGANASIWRFRSSRRS